MQGSVVWACVLLVACLVSAVCGATPSPPPITKYDLSKEFSRPYDVYWVNSTVGFLLTSYGYGTHDLYRTVDEGIHWTKQPLSGNCYVVRIYQDLYPQNLIFMGPPESSCGWNTKDAGETYTPILIPQLQFISPNPYSSFWALGRTADSQIYYTEDLGANWYLMPNVTRATWVLNADLNLATDKLHDLCMYILRGGVFGYTYDQGRTVENLFSNMADLHTTSNFVYAVAQNRALLVGTNYKSIQSAYFPFGNSAPMVFTVSDDVSGATWFFTDSSYYWGNVYTTGSGALYVQSLLHVLKREDAFLDFHSVHGLPGVHLANVVVNFNDYHDLMLKTYITYDNGGSWTTLIPPTVSCPTCTLNLYFNYKSVQRPYYTSERTIGLIIANGYVGPAVSYEHPTNLQPFVSRDAGITWETIPVPAGSYVFDVGSNGGILVMARENILTNTIYYSLDEGATINSFTLPDTVYITKIFTPTGTGSNKFGVFGLDTAGYGIVYGLNFAGFTGGACNTATDYEQFSPSDGPGKTVSCWLGQTVIYSRRNRTVICTDTRGEQQLSSTPCVCTLDDYECDFGYANTGDDNKCYVASTLPPSPPSICTGTYEKSQGYRLVPGDKCVSGLDLKPQVLTCPKSTSTSSGSKSWVAIVVVLVVLAVVGLIVFVIYRDPVLKGRVLGFFGIGRESVRYGRVGRSNSHSLAHEEDFGIQDDLLEDDAKVLHDHDISKEASNKSYPD